MRLVPGRLQPVAIEVWPAVVTVNESQPDPSASAQSPPAEVRFKLPSIRPHRLATKTVAEGKTEPFPEMLVKGPTLLIFSPAMKLPAPPLKV